MVQKQYLLKAKKKIDILPKFIKDSINIYFFILYGYDKTLLKMMF